MKRIILAGLAFGVATSGACAAAQTPVLAVSGGRVAAVARAARLAGEIVVADQTGPVIEIAQGLADRTTGRPHRPGQRWLWASVTKQITAVLVMQQVEAGTLALDGTVRRYLPDFAAPNADRITVRHLLQHLSGLPNPDDSPPDANGVPGYYTGLGGGAGDGARALALCSAAPKAAPGAGFSYNNCDYLVLGAILERLAGQSYAQLVANRLATPLALRSVRLASADGHDASAATGYIAGGKRYPPIAVATFGAAGALIGTARDLIAFDRALVAGKLLRADSRAALWRGDPALGYEALGAWSFPARLAGCAAPVALVERRGDVGGIQVRNVIAPELGRSIAVFTNDDTLDFGEVWQGKGLTFDLLSAALCDADRPASAGPGQGVR